MVQGHERVLTIKDSGERTEFETGAVRDMQKGKGRCDLLPLDVVTAMMPPHGNEHRVIAYISDFTITGDTVHLCGAIEWFRNLRRWDIPTMLLEVSMHFEEGHEKYPPGADGVPNWKLGIPAYCYVNSGVRHYLKWLRGDDDEPHDRAFVWNMMCAIWTCKHKPELNNYAEVTQ